MKMSVEHAIFVLKENASFSDGEIEDATDMAIEALENQIPLESVETWDDGFVCPICNGFVTCQTWKNGKPYNVEFKYCPTCGQKLKQEVE